MLHQNTRKNQGTHTQRRNIVQLAAHGFTFVKCAENDKRPIAKNWPHVKVGAKAAQRHLEMGGNVGVRAGKYSNNIIWLDLDIRATDFLRTFPEFNDTLQSWRDDAPDRRKFAVHVSDALPRTTVWKPEGAEKPHAELLSTGRQACVIGTHPDGDVYRLSDHEPISMTFLEVADIWQIWTGNELGGEIEPATQKAQAQAVPTPTEPHAPNNLAARVKAFWTPEAVFEHFDMAGDVRDENNGDKRLLGYGGLLIRGDEWYCHAEGIGGDAINAWAYCTKRDVHLRGNEFTEILHEMADAAGIDVKPTPQPVSFTLDDGDAIELPFDTAVSILRQKFSDTKLYDSKTVRYDRAVMLALLDTMQRVRRFTGVKLDVRSAGEVSGMTKDTASKTLRRLADYGHIERSDADSWFQHELPDDDRHTANMFDAYAWQLPEQVFHLMTGSTPGTAEQHCHNDEHFLDIDVLLDYQTHDAFQFAAKTDDEHSLGKAALDVIATLSTENDLTYADIAERTGMSRSTASKKARALAAIGITEVYQIGRTCYVYLRENWRDILERVWLRLKKVGRVLKRKITHLHARLARLEERHCVTSGRLHQALYELEHRWRDKLRQLNQKLKEVYMLRTLTLDGGAA